jgi:hypothetical protein
MNSRALVPISQSVTNNRQETTSLESNNNLMSKMSHDTQQAAVVQYFPKIDSNHSKQVTFQDNSKPEFASTQ